jgi:glycosyltransferase involved in cell wall biosynthesis
MRSKIKVLRIITRLSVGGSSIHTILLTAHLDKQIFDSLLIKGSEGKDEGDLRDLLFRKKIDPLLIPELRREISFKNDLITFWKLYKLVRAEKPAIVHTHSAKAGTLGRLAAKLAGVPVIVHTFHGHLFRGYFSPKKSRLVIFIERLLALVSTKIVAVTQSQKDELLRYKIAPSQKIVSIPLGLELDLLQNLQTERGAFRSELGLDKDDALIGSIARLVPVKGHTFLFRAARKVIDTFPRVKILLIGDGELRNELENLASRLGIGKNVVFCGFRRDLPKIYADLDIVALTSLNEGLPVAVIEAMASQTAVVAYDVGGVKDLIEPNVTGISVPFGEIDRLAESIIFLLKNPQERERLGRNARRKVYPSLHYQRLVRDFEKFYLELTENQHSKYEKALSQKTMIKG